LTTEFETKPKTIAYITQWFTPEGSGPALWIAQALAESNFRVKVITANPNYPKGIVFPGYKAWKVKREILHDMETVHCPIYPSHDHSSIKRMANYLSFTISASIFGSRICRKADAILVYSSPATSAVPAMVSNFLFKRPYVLFIQDLWPDTVMQSGMLERKRVGKIVEKALKKFDKISTRRASHVIVISQGMKRALISRGVPESKISVIHNWVDEETVKVVPRTGALRAQLSIPESDLLFMYAGNHGIVQGLDNWILAIAGSQDLTDIHFIFIGDGAEKTHLRAHAEELDLKRIHFLEPVDALEFSTLAADADAQIISLRNEPLFEITIPGKVQTSLAKEMAVLGSVQGDAALVLTESGAGIIAISQDPSGIESVIRQAHAEGAAALAVRGSAGGEYYRKTMSAEHGRGATVEVMNRVMRIESYSSK
jgi:glycosyltransferase involved in cell wall biosynthesis